MTAYCHIGSQYGRVPTQVRAGRLGSEGGVGGAGPNQMKMWSSPGPLLLGYEIRHWYKAVSTSKLRPWPLSLINFGAYVNVLFIVKQRILVLSQINDRTGLPKRCWVHWCIIIVKFVVVIRPQLWFIYLFIHLGPVYTMDREAKPCKMAFSMIWLHGPTSMVWFLSKSYYKAFGPFIRCRLNVDQEVWPCTKKWMCWFFKYMPKKGIFCITKSCLTILLSSDVFIFSLSSS